MKKINKNQARKIFNNGGTVAILPCKMVPGGPWAFMSYINKDRDNDFEKTINAYEYYNCGAETGNYTAYYVNE